MSQVPIPANPNYQVFRAMKWLIESADEKDRSVRVWDKLPFEVLDAYNNEAGELVSALYCLLPKAANAQVHLHGKLYKW